jgi:hypothetical protein
MKKSIGIKLFAFAALALVMTACSKYEEGSKFTFLSKKARMVNTWTVTEYSYNGTNQPLNGQSLVFDLQKDGTAVTTASNGGFSFSDTGKWDFNSDKTNLVMTASDNSTESYEIVMLKNKDLKLRQTVGGVISVWTFSGE